MRPSSDFRLVSWMPSRRRVTARGYVLAISAGALLAVLAALWPKPGWLP